MNRHEFRELIYGGLRETDKAIRKMGYSVNLSSVKIGDEISRK